VLVGLENGERKRREERLKRAADLAVAANEAKIELFASVGHEVRNPLNSIMGFAQILESELADSFHRGCASTIHENGRFLLEIINDLIDITRIENNKLSMRFSAVNPWETIVAVRDLMNIVARDKNLPLEIERGGNVPDEFVSDPKRLRQILINLVGNSIKFTDAGAIRIVLSHDPGAALPLRIEVVDTGVGIEAGEMDRLFEPFFQGSNHSAGGAGLGLSICRKLAAMMGGELSLQSELDKGSTFTLALPLQPELPEVQR
jgi:signal transduction histidine kinase